MANGNAVSSVFVFLSIFFALCYNEENRKSRWKQVYIRLRSEVVNILHRMADRTWFRLFFIFAVFMNTLNLKFFAITENPLFYAVIGWGCYILLHDICTKELLYKGNHLLLLCLYILLAAMATALNTTYASASSWLLVAMQGMVFLLVFAQPKSITQMQIRKELRYAGILTCILCFLASGISLVLFFFNVSLTANDTTIGIVSNRLFGVYFNSNPAAFLACMTVVFSLIAIRNHYRFTTFYMINMIVQLLYILLSGCRNALLMLAILLVILLYYTLFQRKQYSLFQEILIAVGALIVFALGSYVLKRMLYLVPQLQGALIQNGERFHLEELKQLVELLWENPWSHRHEIVNLLDELSSSRIELYANSLRIWKSEPFIGIGFDTFHAMGMQMFPDSEVLHMPQVVHAHNFFLESLVTTGVIGFVCFVFFTFRSFTTMQEVLRRYKGTPSYFIILLLSLIVWMEVMGGFLDYGVFYVYSLSTLLFWMVLGYLYWLYDHRALYLVVNQDAFSFESYRLEEVTYERKQETAFDHAALHIMDEHLDEQRLRMRLAVVLFLNQERSCYFVYQGVFHMRHAYANEAGILRYREAMALELYDIVREDIERLISDDTWKLKLPYGNQELF